MTALIDWQRRFVEALSRPDDRAALVALGVRRDLPAAERLGIHRTNVRMAYIRALEMTYPACLRVVGQACFRRLALDHGRVNPSHHADVGQVAAGFAETLDAVVPSRPELVGFDYLPDLATFEYARFHAAEADEPAPFDWGSVDAGRSDALRLVPHPALGRLDTLHPVRALWRGEPGVLAPTGPLRLVITRAGDGIAVDAIDRETADDLDACLGGASLTTLAAQGVGPAIAHFVGRGWLVGVEAMP